MTTRRAVTVAAALVLASVATLTGANAATPSVGLPFATSGTAVVWGSDTQGQVSDVPTDRLVALVGGYDLYLLGLTASGQVDAWGESDYTSPPALPSGTRYTAIGAADYCALALRSDDVVAQWGNYCPGTPPTPPSGVHVTQLAGGDAFALELRSDGTIVGWGDDTSTTAVESTTVPAAPAGTRYVEVAAGSDAGYALRSDGVVVAWGDDGYQQTDVPALPSGETYTKVVATGITAYALRSDGMIVAWGDPEDGDTSVPWLPVGDTYTDVGIGSATGYALRSDGATVTWGYDGPNHLLTVPAAPAGTQYGYLSGAKSVSFGLLQDETSLTATSTAGPHALVHATVTAPASGAPTPTGAVALYDGATKLAQGTLHAGTATIAVPFTVPVGTRTLRLVYAGDGAVLPSTGSVTVHVTKERTTTTLKAPTHLRKGTVLVTHVVVRPTADATGTVRLLVDGRAHGHARLIHGRATTRVHGLTRGKHSLKVVYVGSPHCTASHSRTAHVTVR